MLLITQGQADGGLEGGVRELKGGGRGKRVSLGTQELHISLWSNGSPEVKQEKIKWITSDVHVCSSEAK